MEEVQNARSVPMPPRALLSVLKLISETISEVRRNHVKILAIITVPLLVQVLLSLIAIWSPNSSVTKSHFIIFGVVREFINYTLYLFSIIGVKIQMKFNWKLTISEVIKRTSEIYVKYFWTYILLRLVMIGAEIPFVVIPATIISIWTATALSGVVFENVYGIHAFSYGRELVRGYWWKVFWRYFAEQFVTLIIFLSLLYMLYVLPYFYWVKVILIALLSAVDIVFSNIYKTKLYLDLRAIKDVDVEASKQKTRKTFIFLAWYGAILTPIICFALVWGYNQIMQSRMSEPEMRYPNWVSYNKHESGIDVAVDLDLHGFAPVYGMSELVKVDVSQDLVFICKYCYPEVSKRHKELTNTLWNIVASSSETILAGTRSGERQNYDTYYYYTFDKGFDDQLSTILRSSGVPFTLSTSTDSSWYVYLSELYPNSENMNHLLKNDPVTGLLVGYSATTSKTWSLLP